MTPVEALMQIRRLCDERERELISILGPGGPAWVRAVRKILDAVSVGAVPPQGIDRETVLDRIRECAPAGMELRYDGTEDKYAAAYVAGVHAAHDAAAKALVRPVEGVTLTPDVRTAFETADSVLRHHGFTPTADLLSGLAARLEARS